MSPTQLKHNLTMKGGFLGMLAGLAARALPFLATAAKTILPSLGIGARRNKNAGSDLKFKGFIVYKAVTKADRSA